MSTKEKPRTVNSSFSRYMNNKYYNMCHVNNKIENKYKYDKYKEHYVCFTCYYTCKTNIKNYINKHKCPLCKYTLINIGLKFQSPKKTNIKKWKHAELLYNNNKCIFTYSCKNNSVDDELPY